MEMSARRHCQRVAHRGGAALAPENTLAAFQQARQWPIDAIELDVQMSRDGHLVVFHDHTVERLTEGRGNILDLDLADLQALDAAAHFPGGWPQTQRIPLLCDVLQGAQGAGLQVHIEIKQGERAGVPVRSPGIAEAVVQEVRTAGMLRQVLVISFDWDVLSHVKALEPALPTGALVAASTWQPRTADALSRLLEKIRPRQCEWIGIEDCLVTPEMPDFCHAQGFLLGVWTVNDLADLHRLARAGVDALTSDRPDLFCALPEALLWRA
jgi:glycerophosphoryl diester phosphodiesterase